MPLNGAGGECEFPAEWHGDWFQNGETEPIRVGRTNISTKGACREAHDNKFLVEDPNTDCFRCIVIAAKHANVLQYQETPFCSANRTHEAVCQEVTRDAQLFSLFRLGGSPVVCPFRGPFFFEYSQGHGQCGQPASSVEACTDPARLLLRFQACADVQGSESREEQLTCLGSWMEGPLHYLVGTLDHKAAKTDEDKFRCVPPPSLTRRHGVWNPPAMRATGIERCYQLATNSTDDEIVTDELVMVAVLLDDLARACRLPKLSYTVELESYLQQNGCLPVNGWTCVGPVQVYEKTASLREIPVAQSGDATCQGLTSPREGSRTMLLHLGSSGSSLHLPTLLTAAAVRGAMELIMMSPGDTLPSGAPDAPASAGATAVYTYRPEKLYTRRRCKKAKPAGWSSRQEPCPWPEWLSQGRRWKRLRADALYEVGNLTLDVRGPRGDLDMTMYCHSLGPRQEENTVTLLVHATRGWKCKLRYSPEVEEPEPCVSGDPNPCMTEGDDMDEALRSPGTELAFSDFVSVYDDMATLDVLRSYFDTKDNPTAEGGLQTLQKELLRQKGTRHECHAAECQDSGGGTAANVNAADWYHL
ncbi:hypothetical protein HPB47_013541, partial [Ixodes persulcatus]